jgi:hypothetical protein
MPLIQIIIVLIIIGLLLWLANTYIPMDAKIKGIMNWVVVGLVVLWLLKIFFPAVMSWGPRVGPTR